MFSSIRIMQAVLFPVILLLLGPTYAALPLPSYVKPCKRLDHECSLKRANEVIPRLLKGDRKYGFPPLNPVEVTEISSNNGPSHAGISLVFRNSKLYGLGAANLTEVHYDIENGKNFFTLELPLLTVISNYEINGRILLLPIRGKGKCNITLVDSFVRHAMDSKLVMKDGKRHAVFYNPRIKMEPKRVYFDLENLFDGNKLLGDEMNIVLNNEWEDAFKEFSPPVLEAANQIMINIINSFGSRVPFDVWFPENV